MTERDWPIWMDSDAFDSVSNPSPVSIGLHPQPASVREEAKIEAVSVETKEVIVTPLGMEEQRELIVSETEAIDDGSRKKNWVFTWNNYTPEDVKTVNEDWLKLPDMRCVVYEPEVGKKGTPHLQGFFVFDKLKSFKQVKEMINKRVWFAQMRKAIEANLKYCSKEKGTIFLGDVPMTRKEKGTHGIKGKESGKDAPDIWAELLTDIKKGLSRKEIMDKYMSLYCAYHAGIEKYLDMFAPRVPFNIETAHGNMYPWQRQLLDIIDLKADARSVIWIYSIQGNTGKTAMFKHLLCMNETFEPFMNAPSRDLACAWKGGSAIFDLARDTGDAPMNYAFMEMIKNGYAFSAKYDSKCKRALDMTKERFVICFSNSRPDVSKLSLDRWAIFCINDALSLHLEDPYLA
ncbi:MAG: putative viral replication protein [Cressdnaviricota sp.]|nr:MAG: putative viral replication protein [Cressdnaviricota sp.]